jgi:hypothetical protein
MTENRSHVHVHAQADVSLRWVHVALCYRGWSPVKVTKNCGVPYSTAMADSSLKEVFLLKNMTLSTHSLL